VGNLQHFEKALHTAVLAPTSVERIEGGVGLDLPQTLGEIVAGIDFRDREPLLAQRIGTGAPRHEAHLAFRRTPAQQDGHMLEIRHGAASFAARPMRLISHSSAMPNFAFTRARTSSPKASMSVALASPVLIRKLQCFSETWAAPCMRPRHPASSMSCQALWPAGFLKVEPPVLLRTGCVLSRCATRASMRARLASGS